MCISLRMQRSRARRRFSPIPFTRAYLFPRVIPALHIVGEFRVLITRLGRHIRTRITGGCRPTGLEAPITTYHVQCPNSKWWRSSVVQFHFDAGSRSKLSRARVFSWKLRKSAASPRAITYAEYPAGRPGRKYGLAPIDRNVKWDARQAKIQRVCDPFGWRRFVICAEESKNKQR